jgi:protein TonB
MPLLAAADAPVASDTAPAASGVAADWAEVPHGACGGGMQRYYPPNAQKTGREGRAVIKCKITVRGTAEDCVVVSEDPPGLGFGQAALGMSCLFKFKPATLAGKPVEAEMTIPIRFGLKQ